VAQRVGKPFVPQAEPADESSGCRMTIHVPATPGLSVTQQPVPTKGPAQPPPMLRVHHVYKKFGLIEVLHNVSLDVAAGTVTCLIGPSGAGKSTLLRCINHLERADRGYVLVGGNLIGYRRVGEKLH
jgi:ABC-type glutathione transport system ATPase component